MREAWTDERLDDLVKHMDREFDLVRSDLREMRGEMNLRFKAVDARFDGLQRTLVIGFAGIAGSVIASAVGAILATQL